MLHYEASTLFCSLNLPHKALAALGTFSTYSKPSTESSIKSCLQNYNLSFIPEEAFLSFKQAHFLDLTSKHCYSVSSLKCNKPNQIQFQFINQSFHKYALELMTAVGGVVLKCFKLQIKIKKEVPSSTIIYFDRITSFSMKSNSAAQVYINVSKSLQPINLDFNIFPI